MDLLQITGTQDFLQLIIDKHQCFVLMLCSGRKVLSWFTAAECIILKKLYYGSKKIEVGRN